MKVYASEKNIMLMMEWGFKGSEERMLLALLAVAV